MSKLINNDDLTKKLNYILKELGMNKKQFLIECKKYNPNMSKPTVINMFKGNNATTPTLLTLQTVIRVCQNSDNEILKRVSFNYLLNDGIYDLEAKNFQLFDELGLNDDTIMMIKNLNTNFIPLNKMEIVNYYMYHTPYKYWDYLDLLKKTYELKKYVNESNKEKIKETLIDVNLGGYLRQFFSNLYELLNKDTFDLNYMNDLFDIVIKYFKSKITELNEKTIANMEENI